MTETQTDRHPARDAELRETARRLAKIAVRENDQSVIIAACAGTVEAAVGMMRNRISPDFAVAFLLQMAEDFADHAEHAQSEVSDGR